MSSKSMRSSDYSDSKLKSGGCLVFSSAVLVQLLQLDPRTLSDQLTIALYLLAVSIPSAALHLVALTLHQNYKKTLRTSYSFILELLSAAATGGTAVLLFWHFSGWAAIAAFIGSAVACALWFLDVWAQEKLNVD